MLAGWSRKVTLTRLVRKAGYKRTVDADFLSRVQVGRASDTRAQEFPRAYHEYGMFLCGLVNIEATVSRHRSLQGIIPFW